ncbi:hypothetical protein AOA60_14055 [Pseudomonas sp. 2822-17]|nr:hypothetical protein AOA60_14055 [Pseudomonas sp. 2822-17]
MIVTDLKYGVESAFVWWSMSGMNDVIERSYVLRTEDGIVEHVADISRRVNGGVIGLEERVSLFNELRSMVELELNS